MRPRFAYRTSPKPPPATGVAPVHGTLAIVNGAVQYTPPQGRGAFPTIEPGEHVRIYCNDRLLQAPTVIFPRDQLRLEAVDVPPAVDVQVEVSRDELTVVLRIRRKPGTRHAIADSPPSTYLKVQTQPVGTIDARPVTLGDVTAALQAARVCHGIDDEALKQAIELANAGGGSEGEPLVVARGDGPQPPRDAIVQLAEGLAPGALVEAGQVLAYKTPAEPGKPGRSVRGAPIPPPPPRDPPLQAGRAAELSPDGLTVTAARGGRLLVHGTTIGVQPVHRVPGDLAGAGVTIRFPGDVLVLGHVREGAAIAAGGKVEIGGGVDGARIESAQSIQVGGSIFRSTLVAGSEAVPAQMTLKALLKRIEHELAYLGQVASAVVRQSGRRDNEVVPFVLERKGTALRESLRQLQAHPAAGELPGQLAQLLPARLTGPGAAHVDAATLDGLTEQVRQAWEGLGPEEAGEASIRVPYAHHSEIKASGRIRFSGRGSYQSHLYAGTGLEAPAGRIVGGEIVVAAGDVVCQTLGGPAAVTHVVVGQEFRVCAYSVLPDIVLQVGGQRMKVTRPYRMVCFRLHDGRITAEAWKG
ncbi:FapA family protein [Carboxydochorda subterranea]|uniref:FapA family protein n=1 Tax=Carboxydichorda subterranea TaxID=3109565 RepID=A0ABZ1BTC7_9FIRM|nr:FapA family protein [Limnochorda sp. L945t]WRP16046.1 FapA family protein [Limnochorda sp. L945t]